MYVKFYLHRPWESSTHVVHRRPCRSYNAALYNPAAAVVMLHYITLQQHNHHEFQAGARPLWVSDGNLQAWYYSSQSRYGNCTAARPQHSSTATEQQQGHCTTARPLHNYALVQNRTSFISKWGYNLCKTAENIKRKDVWPILNGNGTGIKSYIN